MNNKKKVSMIVNIDTTHNQCNLLVGNGTTVGYDNRTLYHSTPLPNISRYEQILNHDIQFSDSRSHHGEYVKTKEQNHRHLVEELLKFVKTSSY